MTLPVAVDPETVKMKTIKIMNGISIVTETVAHKDIIADMHKKHLKINV